MSLKAKAQQAKFAIFASQHTRAFNLFCKEHGITPNIQDVTLTRAFFAQQDTAKSVNKELTLQAKRDKKSERRMLNKTVRPRQVRFNKGFFLINEDCLYGQEPVSDKTQIREPEYTVIQ